MRTAIRILSALCLLGGAARAESFSWTQDQQSLGLVSGTRTVWRVVADPFVGKPYFHPLSTPNGTVLTDFEPADHPWHKGLWFSWKFINGINYWEENPKTKMSQGCTEIVSTKFEPHEDGSALLHFSLRYLPRNGQPLLSETRSVEVSAPKNGSYEVRWKAEFTALADVLLDRTPIMGEPEGKRVGGYAGLSLRLPPSTLAWSYRHGSGISDPKKLQGQKGPFLKFTAGDNKPAVTIFDECSPALPTTGWYLYPTMPFFSPALIYSGSRHLAAGEKLQVQYRLLVTDSDTN